MGLIVTADHIAAAKSAGACRVPTPGRKASGMAQGVLIWFSEHCPAIADAIEAEIGLPLWALSDSGDGYGDGYGYRYGDCCGDCYGYGYGYRYGDGYGDCCGYGYGYRYGDGYGYGYRYGDCYGYGCR